MEGVNLAEAAEAVEVEPTRTRTTFLRLICQVELGGFIQIHHSTTPLLVRLVLK